MTRGAEIRAPRSMSTADLPGRRSFATTRWSLVLRASEREEDAAQRALSELCTLVWSPLYAYARRRGSDPEEARDLTQAFFAQLFERELLRTADPSRGRFRTFLMTAMKNFLVSEWRKQTAQKRGGGTTPVAMDFEDAEESYSREPAENLTPEALFERRWALELLARAVEELRTDYERAGKGELFEALRGALSGDETLPYAELSERLGTPEGTLRTAVSRLRARWRDRIRTLVAETVDDEGEVEDELTFLITSVAGGL